MSSKHVVDLQSQTFAFQQHELMPIGRAEVHSDRALPIDLFLQLNDTKFLLVGRRGTLLNVSSLHFFDVANGKLYVRTSEYKDLVGESLKVIANVPTADKLDAGQKTMLLSLTATAVMREIESLGFNLESAEHAATISNSVCELVESKPDLSIILKALQGISDDVVRHSMAVGAVAVMIAKNMGWMIPQTLEKLTLAGFLHDIGIKEIPLEILRKPRFELSAEERSIYETHSFRGGQILQSMPSVPEEVIAAAMEHHENAIGQGYPRKIRDFRMHPFARIIALSDCFVELTIKDINNPNPRTAAEAVAHISTTMGHPFHKPALTALEAALTKVKTGGRVRVV